MSVKPRPIHLPRRYLVLAAASLAVGALAALSAQLGLPWQTVSHEEVLELDLRRGLPDHTKPGPDGNRSISAVDMLRALDEAARDPGILGVYLRVGGDGMALAQAHELAAAVTRFRDSGKFAVAFAPGFGAANLADRVLAAAADEFWLAPPGEESGAANKAVLAKAALTGLPPERAAAWNALLALATARIAGSPVTEAALSKADPGYVSSDADGAAAAPLLRRGHEAHAERAALARAGAEGAFVSLPAYRDRMDARTGPALALIQAEGRLGDNAADLTAQIAAAANDPDVAGIVLRLSLHRVTPDAMAWVDAALSGAVRSGKAVAVSYGPMVPFRMLPERPPAGTAMAILPGALTMTGGTAGAGSRLVTAVLDGSARPPADLVFLITGEASGVLSPGTALSSTMDVNHVNRPETDGFTAEAAAEPTPEQSERFGTLLDMRDAAAQAAALASTPRLIPYEKEAEPLLTRTKQRLRNIRNAADRITIKMP